MTFYVLLGIGFLFGIGFGFFAQKAGICFAHGLAEIFIGKGKRIILIYLVLFSITAIGFVLSKFIHPDLGIKPVGEIRGYGFYNVLSGLIFGAGIFINGGCILGTLRQIGEGNVNYLIALLAFIPGMAFTFYRINPALESYFYAQKKLLTDVTPFSDVQLLLIFVVIHLIWLGYLLRKKAK